MPTKEYKHNGLDKVEYSEVDEDRVLFFATEEDRERGKYTLTLFVTREGTVKIGSSMTLPTRNWLDYAYAYRRAMDFLVQNNLKQAT